MSIALQLVRRQLKLYEEQPEAWNRDHNVALHCFEVEEAIALGVFLFGRICRHDESFRDAFFNGRIPYDAELQRDIENLYRMWLDPYKVYVQEVEKLEQQGFQLEGAAEFRRCYTEVRGILTPDEDFFASDDLVSVRDAAIDAHRKGESVPIRRMSD